MVAIFPVQLSQKLCGFSMYDSSQLHVPDALSTILLEAYFFLEISVGTLLVLVICELYSVSLIFSGVLTRV